MYEARLTFVGEGRLYESVAEVLELLHLRGRQRAVHRGAEAQRQQAQALCGQRQLPTAVAL